MILSQLLRCLNTKTLTIGGRRLLSCTWDANGEGMYVESTGQRTRKRGFSTDVYQQDSVQRTYTVHQIKRVSIEGNIAVGKSTFAKLLQSASKDWEVVPEPVSKWQNVDTSQKTVSNLLEMMYQDPQRWSYTFQTFSCMSRIRTQLQSPAARLLRARGTPVQVFERSVYSDRYIFALTMFQLGCMNTTEWAVYQNWHSFLLEQFGFCLQVEGIIYLKAPPQTCHERLGRRGRDEEKGVRLDYLQRLHNQHENWLVHRSTELHCEQLKRVPVLVLDAGVEFEKDTNIQKQFISQVNHFFTTL